MTASILAAPEFRKNQIVEFIGGIGIIKNYRPELDSWAYLVEMPMGPEPEMGRIGHETMIWLFEVDISSLFDRSSHEVLSLEQNNLAKAC